MSEHIVKAPHVPPFVTFVTSAVPMVFDNSLSYYEALCALWKWLQDDVVNVINNNATVTEDYIDLTNEYTQKFIELKEYVDTYFDNLDVQEEINNKLDAMVEDGTLQQLIASYLQTQIIYDTTLAMIADAEHLVNGVRVETLGYRSVDDGGAAFFVIKNTGTADGYGVINLENGLYAHMVYLNDSVRPEQFGAYGDGVNDHNDSDAIQYAIDTGKVVELSPKTYTCYGLTINLPATIHGNGATLKRPELDIAPYSMTVDQMKWIKTISISADVFIDRVIFDNNCFTMWQLSDGYAQEQSASIILSNADNQFTAYIDQCSFKNSAGDGILVYNNAKCFITNCESTETFRGGLTMVGTSEINVDGWISNSITLPDGFDIEMASGAIAGNFILNMSNVILDYDLDLGVPADGEAHLNNIVMRETTDKAGYGLRFSVEGKLYIENSTLLTCTNTNFNTRTTGKGKVVFENCDIVGDSSSVAFNFLNDNTNADQSLIFNNCRVKCYDFITLGLNNMELDIIDCDIKCTNSLIIKRGNVRPQPRRLSIKNSFISTATEVFDITQTSYVTWADGVNVYLENIDFAGTGNLTIGGTPKIHFNNLKQEASYVTSFSGVANPVFIGNERFIVVPAASDLTFKGWIAGNDKALALDNGKYYRYTSGTTWTEIS